MRTVLSRLARRFRFPPWVALLLLSAVLFLAGSASFGVGGAHRMAQVGVVGAIAAIAAIAAFAG
ncbi:MAG: hypothetical protein J0H14_06910 [Alphaproteobacteria bacterium]|nr:hypothetical protein [Alphaproteobacteria bacterium]